MPNFLHIAEVDVDGLGSCTQPLRDLADDTREDANAGGFNKPAVVAAFPDAGMAHGQHGPPDLPLGKILWMEGRNWLIVFKNLGLGLRGRRHRSVDDGKTQVET